MRYIYSLIYIYLCRFRYKSICRNLFIFKHSKAAVKVRINRKAVEREGAGCSIFTQLKAFSFYYFSRDFVQHFAARNWLSTSHAIRSNNHRG